MIDLFKRLGNETLPFDYWNVLKEIHVRGGEAL